MFTTVGEAIPNLGANIEAFILLRPLVAQSRFLCQNGAGPQVGIRGDLSAITVLKAILHWAGRELPARNQNLQPSARCDQDGCAPNRVDCCQRLSRAVGPFAISAASSASLRGPSGRHRCGTRT